MATRHNIQGWIQQLFEIGIISKTDVQFRQLSGTTDGLVYSVTDREETIILKADAPDQIALFHSFYQTYHMSPLLPKILYTDPENAYIVYSYVNGTTHTGRGKKHEWMAALINGLLGLYVLADEIEQRGTYAVPQYNWHEFMLGEAGEARHHIQGNLTEADHRIVQQLIQKCFSNGIPEERYLLHGDNGVHNFVFDQFSLAGVIDPSPILGPVTYDFLYAFFSSPDELFMDTLLSLYSLLRHRHEDEARLIEEAVIQLYFRIGTCIKHHPWDLQKYLNAWAYWKQLLN